MLTPVITINKKFKNLVWFHSVFFTYNSIFFYRHSRFQTSILCNNVISLVKNCISYKFFHAKSGLNNLKYFKFLTGSFLVVYTKDFSSLFNSDLSNFQLFAINYYSYFVNPVYLNNLYYNYDFYKQNYLFIISNLLWFLSVINSFIINIVSLMVSYQSFIYNYYVSFYKLLLQILPKVPSKNYEEISD